MRTMTESVRLVALDLDGTVVASDLSVSERIVQVVAQAKAMGIETTLVTGRMFRAARPFIAKLGITVPVICYQGAGIYDAQTGETLRHQPVAHALVQRILEFAREHDFHIQLYAEGTYFVERMTNFGSLYAYVCGYPPLLIPSLAERFANEDSTKVVIVLDPDRAEGVAKELRQLCAADGYVTRSNPEFVEIMAPGVNKGDSLRWVAQRLGISPHAMLAVGDSWNDIPMLQVAAFGVAMGSAPAELRTIADATVADVTNDGVVEAYERFVLRSPS